MVGLLDYICNYACNFCGYICEMRLVTKERISYSILRRELFHKCLIRTDKNLIFLTLLKVFENIQFSGGLVLPVFCISTFFRLYSMLI